MESCLLRRLREGVTQMIRRLLMATVVLASTGLIASAQGTSPSASPAPDARKAAIAREVGTMARISTAFAPSFSPDGKWVSFITNISGAPQVWIVPADGGYPRMVTNGDDPVVSQKWSPGGDWLAVTIAPGGGLNSQVYVVKSDGTGMRLLTKGGHDNNGFDAWKDEGKQMPIDSRRDDPASRDSLMIDLATGNVKLVARNPGVGGIENISHDGKRALLTRVKSRGDNNLYLLD